MKLNCSYSAKCGGCKYIKEDYAQTLLKKKDYVNNLLLNSKNKELKSIKVTNIYGMDNPYYYRNKGKYVFGVKNGKVKMGFFEENSHNIVDVEDCKIQNEIINNVAKYVFSLVKKYNINIYNEDKGKGFLRHLVVRYGVNTNEIMIIFVTTNSKFMHKENIIKDILSEFPNTKTIIQNINERKDSLVLGSKKYIMYGKGFIVDKIENIKFKISPLSFYQVNSMQVQILYNKAIQLAKINKNSNVFDLYSGIGTISLLVSKNAAKVYGIEVVKDAVKDANENAKLNKINNCFFIQGKVEDTIFKLIKKVNPDVIFVDPPRSGLDEKLIKVLNQLNFSKLVYISCNPQTLVSNLEELSIKFNIESVNLVDMFPFTSSIESIAVLKTKKEKA